jgi:hypothetical protein
MSCPIHVKGNCVKSHTRSGKDVKGYCRKPSTRKCSGTVVVHQKKRTEADFGGPNKRLDRNDSIKGSATGYETTKGGRNGRSTGHFTYRGDKGVGAYVGHMGYGEHSKAAGYSQNTTVKKDGKTIIKMRKYKIKK